MQIKKLKESITNKKNMGKILKYVSILKYTAIIVFIGLVLWNALNKI